MIGVDIAYVTNRICKDVKSSIKGQDGQEVKSDAAIARRDVFLYIHHLVQETRFGSEQGECEGIILPLGVYKRHTRVCSVRHPTIVN